MIRFMPFHGVVTMIDDFMIDEPGCYKIMSVDGGNGNIVNFVISPDTYFANQVIVQVGDRVTAYYDGNAPAILIYPPQYPALIVVKDNPYQNVKADFFNSELISSDGQLKLNLSPFTSIQLRNGQPFTSNPANRNLIVFYGATTRSIPAQTTPTRIIVWCG